MGQRSRGRGPCQRTDGYDGYEGRVEAEPEAEGKVGVLARSYVVPVMLTVKSPGRLVCIQAPRSKEEWRSVD